MSNSRVDHVNGILRRNGMGGDQEARHAALGLVSKREADPTARRTAGDFALDVADAGQAQVERAQEILGGVKPAEAVAELTKRPDQSRLPASLITAYRAAFEAALSPVTKSVSAAEWADGVLQNSVAAAIKKWLPLGASARDAERAWYASYDKFVRQDPNGRVLLAMSLDGHDKSPAEYVGELRKRAPAEAALIAGLL